MGKKNMIMKKFITKIVLFYQISFIRIIII